MLGIRVSNRIRGKYVYTIEDLKTGKKFANPALISNYPIDVHTKDKNSSTLEKTGESQLPGQLFFYGRSSSKVYRETD